MTSRSRHSLHDFAARAAAGAAFAWASFAPCLAHAQDLAPPPAMGPNMQQPQVWQPQTMTTQQLNTAEREDSGRGLEFFYVNGGAGFSYVGLPSYGPPGYRFTQSSAVGPELDLGLGVRLLVLTIGPRVRFHPLTGYDLIQANLEVAVHLPLGSLDLYGGVHGGYSMMAKTKKAFEGAATTTNSVGMSGGDVGLDLGADYYLSSLFSIGGALSGEVIFLKTSDLPPPDTKGSATGVGLVLGARAGLHF